MVERPLQWWRRVWLALICAWKILIDAAFARRCYELPVEARSLAGASGPDAALDAPAVEAEAVDDAAVDDAAVDDAAVDDAAVDDAAAAPAAPGGPADGGAQASDSTSAQLLLGLLQRRGRLVDFLQQEIDGFDDADVAVAARLVHQGCRQALAEVTRIEPVTAEAEGSPIELAADYDGAATKLTGRVRGEPPYRGVVRHRGWRVTALELPELLADHDAAVIAPAEVEL